MRSIQGALCAAALGCVTVGTTDALAFFCPVNTTPVLLGQGLVNVVSFVWSALYYLITWHFLLMT